MHWIRRLSIAISLLTTKRYESMTTDTIKKSKLTYCKSIKNRSLQKTKKVKRRYYVTFSQKEEHASIHKREQKKNNDGILFSLSLDGFCYF